MMDTKECREEFEAWADENQMCPLDKTPFDEYACYETHDLWLAWRAAWNRRAEHDHAGGMNMTTDREIMQMALDALTHGCPPDCKNGMTDSGGVLPWGEPALVPCPTCATISALRERLAEPEQEPKAVLNKAAETAPKEIWLQIGDEPEHLDEPFPYGQDVTWCQESVLQAEVRYIRADIDARRPARELSDEEIDLMAESVIASMDNGLRGFLKTWGWRQFARAILARARGEK